MVAGLSSLGAYPIENKARLRPWPFQGCRDRRGARLVAIRSIAAVQTLHCPAPRPVPNHRFAKPPAAARMQDMEVRSGDETGYGRIPAWISANRIDFSRS